MINGGRAAVPSAGRTRGPAASGSQTGGCAPKQVYTGQCVLKIHGSLRVQAGGRGAPALEVAVAALRRLLHPVDVIRGISR
jgi:hypothetical protein